MYHMQLECVKTQLLCDTDSPKTMVALNWVGPKGLKLKKLQIVTETMSHTEVLAQRAERMGWF